MLASILISMYTSRLVLQTLGVSDFGIYNVVGGFVSMFTVISNSLAAAESRFLTFELGKGSREQLRNVFATSVLIQIVISLVVLLAVETLGLWFLNNKMILPEGREFAATCVFQCSVFAILFSIMTVPFHASIIAHEEMGIFAAISISEVILKLIAVLLLSIYGSDKLIIYAVLLLAISFFVQTATTIYSLRKFNETRHLLTAKFDKSITSEMLAFACWNLIGSVSVICNGQGINVLFNTFFGTTVNAARGLSVTVYNIVCNFINSFTTAINPQITKNYASGDLNQMGKLIYGGTKFAYFSTILIVLPITLEAEYLLNLWLGEYPEHTLNFVRLAVLSTVIEVPSLIVGMGHISTGKIKNYQITIGGLQILTLPLAYIALNFGYPAEVTYIIAMCISICCLCSRLAFARKSVGLKVCHFIKEVYMRLILITTVSVPLPFLLHKYMELGFGRLCGVFLLSTICISVSSIMFGLNKREREFIYSLILRKLRFSKN